MSHTTSAQKRDKNAQPPEWKEIVAAYQTPCRRRAIWQLVNTFGSYVLAWGLMYVTLQISWWLTLPLAILAGGLLVRIFIIFHDCGHGSFMSSREANKWIGRLGGLLTFTAFHHWRWQHGTHHATSGDLDRRGVGDMWTMTVEEYLAASRWKRLSYRLARNPIMLFVVAPLYLFVIHQRFPLSKAPTRAKHSVWWNNLAIVVMIVGMSLIYGVGPYLILQAIVLGIAGTAGIWLFYVQHQFEDVYWANTDEWDFTAAALEGSSYYKLPRILQWFSGNIGFHHIHHLSPRIPNYNLERCHRADSMFEEVPRITIRSSLKSLWYRLWDESSKKLVSFRQIRHRPRQDKQQTARD